MRTKKKYEKTKPRFVFFGYKKRPTAARPRSDRMERTTVNLISSDEDEREVTTYGTGPGITPANGEDFRVYLERGTWLNDEIINGYVGMLNREIFPQREIDPSFGSVFFTNSFLLPHVERNCGDPDRIYRLCRGLRKECPPLGELAWICSPVNVDNEHWIFFAACLKYRVFVVYDSMRIYTGHAEAYDPIVRKKLDHLAYFLRRYEAFCIDESQGSSSTRVPRGGRRTMEGNWIVRYADFETPQAVGDYYNCGVYALTCAEIYSHHNVPYLYVTDVRVRDIHQRRLEILSDSREGFRGRGDLQGGGGVAWDYVRLENFGKGFRESWDLGHTEPRIEIPYPRTGTIGFRVEVNVDPHKRKTSDSYRLVDGEDRREYNAKLLEYKMWPLDPLVLPPPSDDTILVFSEGRIARKLIKSRSLLKLADLVWDGRKKMRSEDGSVHVVTRLSHELESLFLFQRRMVEFLKIRKDVEKVTLSVVRKGARDGLEKFVGEGSEIVAARDVSDDNPLYDPKLTDAKTASDFMVENDAIYYLFNDFPAGTLELVFYDDMKDLSRDVENRSAAGVDLCFTEYDEGEDGDDRYKNLFCEVFQASFCRLYVNEVNETLEVQISVPRCASSVNEEPIDDGARSFGYAERAIRHTYEGEMLTRRDFGYRSKNK